MGFKSLCIAHEGHKFMLTMPINCAYYRQNVTCLVLMRITGLDKDYQTHMCSMLLQYLDFTND